MAKKLNFEGKDIEIVPGFTDKLKNKNNVLVSTGDQNKQDRGGISLSNNKGTSDVQGKEYPGSQNYDTLRILAQYSTVVRAIVTLRSQQVSKMRLKIIPKDPDEPIRQSHVLKYKVPELDNHPAFSDDDKDFLREVYDRLDPKEYVTDKRQALREKQGEFSDFEIETIKSLQDKHDEFYRDRNRDTKKIEKLLNKPDPYFTFTTSWHGLLQRLIEDILVLDRGVLIKVRDDEGNLVALIPADGSTVLPVIGEYGFLDVNKAYVQRDATNPTYFRKDDVVIFIMNPTAERHFFGFGKAPLDTLYQVVLSDLFIDKGNTDYYKKGGSIPEGMIAIEPPTSKEGVVSQMDQEQLDAIQRQLQAIIMGDFTQVPIVSGGKIEWIDFKGKRKDMQFKELADYIIRKICAVLQVSPQDVGILDGVKTSDGEVQADLTDSKGLETLMNVISEHLTNEVASEIRPQEDLKVWFEERSTKRKKEEWEMINAKIQANYMSVNEARALDGLSPVAWGDTPMQGLHTWIPDDPNKPSGLGLGAPPGMGGGLPGAGMPGMAPPPMPGMGGPVMKSAFENNTSATAKSFVSESKLFDDILEFGRK